MPKGRKKEVEEVLEGRKVEEMDRANKGEVRGWKRKGKRK